jgi:hypothetical protein
MLKKYLANFLLVLSASLMSHIALADDGTPLAPTASVAPSAAPAPPPTQMKSPTMVGVGTFLLVGGLACVAGGFAIIGTSGCTGTDFGSDLGCGIGQAVGGIFGGITIGVGIVHVIPGIFLIGVGASRIPREPPPSLSIRVSPLGLGVGASF